jgi:hypothetical protein
MGLRRTAAVHPAQARVPPRPASSTVHVAVRLVTVVRRSRRRRTYAAGALASGPLKKPAGHALIRRESTEITVRNQTGEHVMNTLTSGPRRPVALLLVAGLVVASSVAAAVALGSDGRSGVPAPSAPAASSPIPTPAPSVSPSPTGRPVPPATPEPTPDPTAEPSADPSAEPTDGGGGAMPIRVDLETLTPHDVYVDIVDRSGTVVEAASEIPTASAPVAEHTLDVENVDPTTLRLTWVDRPGSNALALYIDEAAARFVLVQPEHDLDGDAMLHDRVLILTFSEAISADEVEAVLQNGVDMPG